MQTGSQYSFEEILEMIHVAGNSGIKILALPGFKAPLTVNGQLVPTARPAPYSPKVEGSRKISMSPVRQRDEFEDLGNIVCDFGKYKGWAFKRIPRKDLHDYVTFLWKGMERRDFSPLVLVWLDQADKFLELRRA